ncbi:MAG: DUF58 domain-containing protein [Halobacteriaceae archaeon]
MNRTRRLAYVAAAIAAILGLAGVLQPTFGRTLLGGTPLLDATALVALALAAQQAVRWVRTTPADTVLAERGQRRGVHLAGERIDQALADRSATARDRIREVVIDALTAATGDDPATVEASVEDGSWTEDAEAATFLASDVEQRDGVLRRFLEALRGFPTPRRRAARVATVLAERAEVDLPTTEDSPPPPTPGTAGRGVEAIAPGELSVHDTARWTGLAALPLFAVGTSVFIRSPTPALVAAVGTILLGYVHSRSPPTPSLAVTHRIEDTTPAPGETVRVTLAITNEGETTVPGLRVCDGVPDGLAVTRGRPTLATTLRPGDTATLTYAVEARFGDHVFDPVYAVTRDAAGASEAITRLPVTSEISCIPPLPEPDPTARARTTPYTGQVGTDTGGQGVEFYGTREYRHGDPLARVDWKRMARTGDLSTIVYRQEQAAAVVLLIDARRAAYVAPTRAGPTAVDHSVQAAAELFGGLVDAGDQVGLTALGPRPCWLPPSAGDDHRARFRQTLANDDAFGAVPPSDSFQPAQELTRLRARIDAGNIVFCSPLVDDWAVSVVRRLEVAGHAVSVVSPDPTGSGRVGDSLARVRRSQRLTDLRRRSISVADWDPEEPLPVALARVACRERER